MSITIDVFPIQYEIPTYRELTEKVNSRLKEFFDRYNIKVEPKLKIELVNKVEQKINFDFDTPIQFENETYCSIQLNNYSSVCFLYFNITQKIDREVWEDEIEDREKARVLKREIEKSLKTGHYWTIKRYSDTDLAVDLVYGIVAGSIAELTNGIIHSYDGAWEEKLFPVFYDDFFMHYFRPESTKQEEFKEWSLEVISYFQEK